MRTTIHVHYLDNIKFFLTNIHNYLHFCNFAISCIFIQFSWLLAIHILPVEDCSSGSRKLVLFLIVFKFWLYLVGIRFAHIANSLADPFADAPLLRLLLLNIKWSIGLVSRRCLPVSMSVMHQLKGALADDSRIASQVKLTLWSAVTLAFFAFLRSSEFTSPFSVDFNPLVHRCAVTWLCQPLYFFSSGHFLTRDNTPNTSGYLPQYSKQSG